MLHSRNTYTTIHIYMREHNQQYWRKNTLLYKNIPLTLYSKGLRKCCVWEVSWRQNWLQHIGLKFISLIQLGCSTVGPESSSPLLGAGSHCLELELQLQLIDSNCGTGLYKYLTSTFYPWASQLNRIQPVHGQGCPCFLIDGWIEGQYVTKWSTNSRVWKWHVVLKFEDV